MSYVYDQSLDPPSFLPEAVHAERSRMVDVTRVGDRFRCYYDPATGKTYDGNEYAREAATETRRIS